MILTETETTAIKDLQTQEQSCIEKYKRYSGEAKDTELKTLFQRLEKEERQHYEALGKVLSGTVPSCSCNDSDGKSYSPQACYSALNENDDKKNDCFLATDCIGTEKMVSSEYNSNVFKFSEPSLRKLLADHQVEEQNHAEMLYKYKTVNGMA